jgi:hypothetical protein
LDTLREVGDKIDGQFLPASNEIQKILGALVHYVERDVALTDAAEQENPTQAVTELLQPEPAEPAAADQGELARLRAELSDLQAAVASREATSKQTKAGGKD